MFCLFVCLVVALCGILDVLLFVLKWILVGHALRFPHWDSSVSVSGRNPDFHKKSVFSFFPNLVSFSCSCCCCCCFSLWKYPVDRIWNIGYFEPFFSFTVVFVLPLSDPKFLLDPSALPSFSTPLFSGRNTHSSLRTHYVNLHRAGFSFSSWISLVVSLTICRFGFVLACPFTENKTHIHTLFRVDRFMTYILSFSSNAKNKFIIMVIQINPLLLFCYFVISLYFIPFFSQVYVAQNLAKNNFLKQ